MYRRNGKAPVGKTGEAVSDVRPAFSCHALSLRLQLQLGLRVKKEKGEKSGEVAAVRVQDQSQSTKGGKEYVIKMGLVARES